jgi:hypothetical protein
MGRQEGVDCIYRTEDRDKWQAVVDTITDLCILLGKKDSCELRKKEGV